MHRELQRKLTVETLLKHRISAPTEWIGASDPTTQCDPLDWLNEGEERNLALRLVDGLVELRIKAPDRLWSEGFYEACKFLKVDARFAYGVHWGSSVLLKIEDPGTIDRWREIWPRGFRSKADAWIETTFEYSLTPTKTAKPVWRSSLSLPGSTIGGDLVYWRPGGKPPAELLDLGLEDLELRPVAATNMESICRAIAFATLAYWIRPDLEGEWDGSLTRLIGGWLAREAREGAKINALGAVTTDKCWAPVDTLQLADQLVAFLQKHVHAPGELSDRLHKADAELARNFEAARIAGWSGMENYFGLPGKVGIRRAFRAGLDVSRLEQLGEQYVYDTSSHSYVDRQRIAKGLLPFEFKKDDLIQQYSNDQLTFGKKRFNSFDLFAKSEYRRNVGATMFFPSVEPGAVVRWSPVLKFLQEDQSHHDEHHVVNSFPGFPVKPIQTPDPKIMRYIRRAITRMFGLLTRYDRKQMLWLKKWVAWIVQRPAEKQAIAPILIGGQAIGKTCFGEDFMRALFGSMSGKAIMEKDDKFIVAPFIGNLVTFCDEVRMESVGNINKLKQLIRQTEIPGQMKFAHARSFYLPTRIILASNTAEIGFTAEDQGDRALYFIKGYTADHFQMNKFEFNEWTFRWKPFYAELVGMLQRLDVRQHLMRFFMDIKVANQSELERTEDSAKGDEEIVRATMSKARSIARQIVADARVGQGDDIGAWFNHFQVRDAIRRWDDARVKVEVDQVIMEWDRAGVLVRMSGGQFKFRYGYVKLLKTMGQAHGLDLHSQWPINPLGVDHDDENKFKADDHPQWRGNKFKSSNDGAARGGFYNQRRDPDHMDPF